MPRQVDRESFLFDVFVPAVKASPEVARLARGSAIVSLQDERGHAEGRRLCYFEGNVFGAVNMNTFPDKLTCAAGRAVEQYPTMAKGFFDPDDLVLVGTYDYAFHQFSVTGNRDALNAWLGEPLAWGRLAH